MELFDSHSHLFLPEFDSDRDIIIKQAISNGITKIILPNIDTSTITPVIEVSKKFNKHCYPALGLHPTSVKTDYQEQLDTIINSIQTTNIIAIGEIGIDLYWDKTFLNEQQIAFEFQIDLANKLNLPVIIHCRDAFEEIISLLEIKRANLPSGVFHSFTGNISQAKKIFELGFKIGINGVVTYKNANMNEMIAYAPLHEILLETDSPYLTPVPFRGKRNNSSYLIYIAQKIAEIKLLKLDEVASVTTQNALTLFKLQH